MKSTDANLNKIQNNQSQTTDEPEPSQLNNIQQLLLLLSSILAKKYNLDSTCSKNFAQSQFKGIKELSILNPDKIIRNYHIFPLSDENIYKYLIEKEKIEIFH